MTDPLSRRALDLRDALRLTQRDLDRLAREIAIARPRLDGQPAVLEIYGAGALVQGYYSHLERVFERVARDLNSAPLAGPDWHRRLLLSMTLEREGVRPALFDAPLAASLDELLRFRHLSRNLYVLDLEAGRVAALCDLAAAVHAGVDEALRRFAAFLEKLTTSGDGDV